MSSHYRWFARRPRRQSPIRRTRPQATRPPLAVLLLEDRMVPALSVSNVAVTPAVTEGGTAHLTGAINDTGANHAYTLLVNWGDGSQTQSVNLPVGTTTFDVPHVYQNNPAGSPVGPFNITVNLTDDAGETATGPGQFAGPNAFGYSAYAGPVAGARINVTDPNAFIISDDDDDWSFPVDLGSNTFTFYNTTYSGPSSLLVSTNGFITFNGMAFFANDLTTDPSPATIAPLAEDWVTYQDANDMVLGKFVDLNGDGQADQLVVQWTDIQAFFGSPPATFQAVLNLNTGSAPGDVVFNYLTMNPNDGHSNGALGAAGIKDDSSVGADAISVKAVSGFTSPFVAEGKSIRFTAGPAAAATATITVSNAPPAVTGLNLSATTVSRGGTATLTGTVSDPGALDLLTVTVNWGDGSTPDVVGVDPATRTFSYSHTYPQTGTFTIQVTAADADGGVSQPATTPITVANSSPVVTDLSGTPTLEGQTTTLTGTIQDNGTNDHFTVAVDWNGDGRNDQTFTSVPAGTFAFTHQYLDDVPGGVPVRVTVTNAGGSTVATTRVSVANVAPTLTLDPVAAIDEGGTVTLSGLVTDPGVLDTFVLVVRWGDGSDPQLVAVGPDRRFSAQHTYLNNLAGGAAYAVSVSVADNGGGAGLGLTSAAVANVAPGGVVLNSGSINEGGTFTLSGSFADPGVLDGHTVVITWGDGSAPTTLALDPNVLTFSASHLYVDDAPGGAAVGVTVTDSDGGAVAAGTTVAVANVAPTVSLDPVAAISEGGVATLSGVVSDPGVLDTFTVTVNWGDGGAAQTVAVGADRHFSAQHQYLNNPAGGGSFTIGVTAADNGGAAGSAAATAAVANVAPTAAPLTGPRAGTIGQFNSFTGVRGLPLTFGSALADPGTLDKLTVTWDFGDGTTQTGPAAAGAVSAAHAYAATGTYTVRLTVRDGDGGTATVSATVCVSAAEVQADPLGGTALVVGGTAGNDTIKVTADGSTYVQVKVNGVNLGTFAPTNRVVVYGLAGDDTITVDNDLKLSAWLYGGDGNDTLTAGGGNDVLLGGGGADTLLGRKGCDLLIGGAGCDSLTGNRDCDLLIGGTTAWDNSPAKLNQIMTCWTSSASFQSKVAALSQGLLAPSNVFDDGAVDVLDGAAGRDWIIGGRNDIVRN